MRCSDSPSRSAITVTSQSAEATVTQALDVCERAGLIGQSIQATSMRALMLALTG